MSEKPSDVSMRLAEVASKAFIVATVTPDITADEMPTFIARALDEAGVQEAMAAIDWVTTDMWHKAPEQFPSCVEAWRQHLFRGVAKLKGTK